MLPTRNISDVLIVGSTLIFFFLHNLVAFLLEISFKNIFTKINFNHIKNSSKQTYDEMLGHTKKTLHKKRLDKRRFLISGKFKPIGGKRRKQRI